MGGFGSPDSEARLFRYTVGKWSKEFGYGIFFAILTWRILKRGHRHIHVYTRHPVAMIVTISIITTLLIHPLITLTASAALYAGLGLLMWRRPDLYRQHIQPRLQGTLYGFKARFRLRHKLKACGLIDNDDPTPVWEHTNVQGCLTTIRLKMVAGQEIEWYRMRASRIAQTFKALDCTPNPYRIGKTTKPQHVILQLLAKDPFVTHLGPEFIDYHHQPDTFAPAVATLRNGQPHNHNLAAHRLRVAMTRWGKSNAIRAMVYANQDKIRDRQLELWGIDGKGGVEQSFLQHVFARVAYGDYNPESMAVNIDSYNPSEFDRLLKDAVTVLKTRQRAMRGNVTEHIPTPDAPWLLIVIDELLVLTSKAVPPELRTSIAASIMVIQQQGIACGVSLDASTQLAQKDKIDFRDGFTEFEVGKVERGAVDMIFGSGWWERGAKADEIPDDLKGVFYKKTDTTMAPTQIRYPDIPVADVSPKRLNINIEKSMLWPPKKRLIPVTAAQLSPTSSNGNGHHGPATNGHGPSTNGHQPADEDVTSALSRRVGGFA